MKLLMAILFMFAFTQPLMASDITVTIDGQTYQCSGNGGSNNCSGKVTGFSAIIKSCMRTYGGGYCQSTYWPKYKSQNPSCIYDAIPTCLEACEKTYGSGYCATQCQ